MSNYLTLTDWKRYTKMAQGGERDSTSNIGFLKLRSDEGTGHMSYRGSQSLLNI